MTAQTPSWQVDPNAAKDEMEKGIDGMTSAIIMLRLKLLGGGIGPEAADRMCTEFFAMLMRQMGGAR